MRIARLLRYLFFGLVAVVFQTTVVPGIDIVGQRPDLIVVLAVIAGAFEGASFGSVVGFLAGLLVDLNQPATFGAGAIAGTMAGYLGGRLQEFLDLDLVLNEAVALVAVGVVHIVLYLVVASIKAGIPFWRTILIHGPGGALYTALVGTLLFRLLIFLGGRGPQIVRR